MFNIKIVEEEGFVTLKCFDHDRATIHQSPKWFSQDEIRLLLSKGSDPDYSVTTVASIGMFSELLLCAFRANIDFGITADGEMVFKCPKEENLVNIVLIRQDNEFIQSIVDIPRDHVYVTNIYDVRVTAGVSDDPELTLTVIDMAHHNKMPWQVCKLANGSVGIVVYHDRSINTPMTKDSVIDLYFSDPTNEAIRKLVDVVAHTEARDDDTRNSIEIVRDHPIAVSWFPRVMSNGFVDAAVNTGLFLLGTDPTDCDIDIMEHAAGRGSFRIKITSSDDEFLTLAATTLL